MPAPEGGDPRGRHPAPPPPFVPPPPPPPFPAAPAAAGGGPAGTPPGWGVPEDDLAGEPFEDTGVQPAEDTGVRSPEDTSVRSPEDTSVLPAAGGGPVPGWGGDPGRDGVRVRERRLAMAVAALAAAVVVTAGALVGVALTSGGHTRASASHRPPATSPPPSTSTTAPPTTAPPTTAPAGGGGRAVAAQIASQVARSGSLRQSVDNSITQVAACSLPPDQGQAALKQAIDSRRGIIDALGKLAPQGLPHGAEMIDALKRSLADSVAADGQYAHWMGDVAGGSPPCSDPAKDPYFAAADAQSKRATADKQAFLALWNPVAPGYGQPTYSASDF